MAWQQPTAQPSNTLEGDLHFSLQVTSLCFGHAWCVSDGERAMVIAQDTTAHGAVSAFLGSALRGRVYGPTTYSAETQNTLVVEGTLVTAK